MKSGLLKRTAAVFVVIAMLMTLLAGCSKSEIDLLKALMNTEPVYSYESTGSVEISYDLVENERAPSYSRDYYGSARVMKEFFDGARLDTSVKVSMDKDYNSVKEEIIMVPSLLGGQLKNLTAGLWIDFQNEDPEKFDMYIKMPPILAAINRETAGKEYLTIDYIKLLELAGEEANISMADIFNIGDVAKVSNAAAEPISQLILKAAAMMDPGLVYVSSVRPVVDSYGKMGNVYTLRISDEGLKQLLRSIINDIDEDTMKEFVLTIIDASIAIYGSYSSTDMYEDMIEELEYLRDEVDENFSDGYRIVCDAINDALDILENVSLLGSKGITFDIEVDSKGFVTGVDGIIDISFDIAGLIKELSGPYYYSEPDIKRFDFTMKISQKLSKINQKVNIEIPETNKQNSVALEDLIEDYMSQSYYDYYDYYDYYNYYY